jgi:hypothetical protein
MTYLIFFIYTESFRNKTKTFKMPSSRKASIEGQLPVIKMEPAQLKQFQIGALALLDMQPNNDLDFRNMQLDKFMKALNVKVVASKLDSGEQIFKKNIPVEYIKNTIHEFIREKFDTLDMESKLKAFVPATYCGVNLHDDEELTKIVNKFFTLYFGSVTVVNGFIDFVYFHVFTDKMRNEFVTFDKSVTTNEEKTVEMLKIFQEKYEKNGMISNYFGSSNFDKFWKVIWENDTLDSKYEKFTKLHTELRKKIEDENIKHFLGLAKSSETDDSIKMEERNGFLGALYKKVHKTKAPPTKKEPAVKKTLSKSEKAMKNAKLSVEVTQSVVSEAHNSDENHTMPSEVNVLLVNKDDKDADNSDVELSEAVEKKQRIVNKYKKKVQDAEDGSEEKAKAEKQLAKAMKDLEKAKKEALVEAEDDE